MGSFWSTHHPSEYSRNAPGIYFDAQWIVLVEKEAQCMRVVAGRRSTGEVYDTYTSPDAGIRMAIESGHVPPVIQDHESRVVLYWGFRISPLANPHNQSWVVHHEMTLTRRQDQGSPQDASLRRLEWSLKEVESRLN